MGINEKILKLRREKNLSQEELGNLLNVSRQTVSKWETGESNPDFDKIVPLCEIFDISSDELLMDKPRQIKEEKNETTTINKKRKAIFICSAIFLYFLSIIQIIILDGVGVGYNIYVPIFFLLCSFGTVLIIYYNITKDKKTKDEVKSENKIIKRINEIVDLITVIVYLLISFLTGKWYITWIIFIINELIMQIIKLIFELRGEDNEK